MDTGIFLDGELATVPMKFRADPDSPCSLAQLLCAHPETLPKMMMSCAHHLLRIIRMMRKPILHMCEVERVLAVELPLCPAQADHYLENSAKLRASEGWRRRSCDACECLQRSLTKPYGDPRSFAWPCISAFEARTSLPCSPAANCSRL